MLQRLCLLRAILQLVLFPLQLAHQGHFFKQLSILMLIVLRSLLLGQLFIYIHQGR